MLQTLPPTSCPPSTSFSPAAHSHFPLPHRLSAHSLRAPASCEPLPWPSLATTPKPAFFPPSAASSPPTFLFSPLPFSKPKLSQRRRRLSSSSSGDEAEVVTSTRSKRRKRDDPLPPPTPPRSPPLLAADPASIPSPFLLARLTDLPRGDGARYEDDMDLDVFSWPQLEDLGLPLSAEEEAVLPEREGGRKGSTMQHPKEGKRHGRSASPASSTGGGATDEDQHGEEREEGLKPSLFRLLPSEVISHILLLAEADNMPAPLLPFSFDDDRDSVVRCSHHRFLILDGLTDRQPILDLASKGDEQLAVRRLLYAPTDDPVALEYQCAILRSLKNLRHFEIEFDERVPRLITALFASFQHLTSLRLVTELKFGDSWPLEDQSFSIGRDLPSLERFEAYPKSPLPQLLSTPCPNLKYLDVFIDTHERESFDWLPWSSLTSLTLFLTDSTTKSVKPLRFLSSSLQKALVPAEGDQQASALPLRRLHINNIAFFSSEYDRGNVTSAAAKAFFDVLRPLQLVSLSIELSVKLCAPWHGTALPSVRSLHLLMMGLEDPQPWRHDIPKRLSSIIVCFSTVETTFLDCVDFSGSMGDEDSPDSFDFMLERPFLFALVSFVKRSTSVVRFDWRPYDCAPLLYRWTRSNRDEDFCGERYREF